MYSRIGKAKLTPHDVQQCVEAFNATFFGTVLFTKINLFEEEDVWINHFCIEVTRTTNRGYLSDNWKHAWSPLLSTKNFDNIETK